MRYRRGEGNPADVLSRMPLPTSTSKQNVADEYVNFIAAHAVPKSMTLQEIQQATQIDIHVQYTQTDSHVTYQLDLHGVASCKSTSGMTNRQQGKRFVSIRSNRLESTTFSTHPA